MITIKRFAALACLLTVLVTVDNLWAYDTTGPWTNVVHIYSRANGATPYVVLGTDGMPGCYDDRGGYLGVAGDDTDKTYSMLLSALVAGREVKIFYNYTGVASGWGMCTIDAVYIR